MSAPAETCLVSGFGRRIFPAGSSVLFRTGLSPALAGMQETLSVMYVRDDWRREDGSVTDPSGGNRTFWQRVPFRCSGNTLSFRIRLNGEHEHTVMISARRGDQTIHEKYSFYSLHEDIAFLRAYKGNIHSHSTRSDGLFPPETVPCIMRGSGFDFFALTDHDKYLPSLEAAGSMAAFGCGLECYCGEEVSTCPGVNHVLSLGAASSIRDWQTLPDSDFMERVKKLEGENRFAELPEHERHLAAQTEILFRKVREEGGLSVFCHPYWFCESRYYSTPLENDFLLRHGSFDAVELGNHQLRRMAMLNARLAELGRETGFRKPLVGSSDWHGREHQSSDVDYTIIFSESPRFEEFAAAVRSEKCVAVGGCKDEFSFGSFRLVKYAYFLMEHFFRGLHDPLCKAQGELLLSSLKDGKDRSLEIGRLERELENLYGGFFASREEFPPRNPEQS